ncbi:MAG: fimbrial biogenesis chaperone [Burkholderiales bacterium]
MARVTAGVGLGLFLFAGAAHPDTLVVQPEQLSLSATRPVADIQIHNSSAEETTVHFDVAQWRQEGDRDLLTPSNKLIVHPERIRLQPGASAKVSVVLRLSGPWWDEEAFRILVTETPPIPDVGVETAHSAGHRITRRSSLPVFLLPPGSANPQLAWSFECNRDGAVLLRASNSGRGHARLTSASLLGPAGQSIHKHHMSDVLLPGGARSWELAPDATAGLWHLTADTNAGPMRAELNLDPDLSAAKALTFTQ